MLKNEVHTLTNKRNIPDLPRLSEFRELKTAKVSYDCNHFNSGISDIIVIWGWLWWTIAVAVVAAAIAVFVNLITNDGSRVDKEIFATEHLSSP